MSWPYSRRADQLGGCRNIRGAPKSDPDPIASGVPQRVYSRLGHTARAITVAQCGLALPAFALSLKIRGFQLVLVMWLVGGQIQHLDKLVGRSVSSRRIPCRLKQQVIPIYQQVYRYDDIHHPCASSRHLSCCQQGWSSIVAAAA